MKFNSTRYLPLVVTVGQVVIFPYYIIWLKQVSLTFTLFAWFFASFSFAAAWGYRIYQTKKNKERSFLFLIYAGMGVVYIVIGFIKNSYEYLPYIVLPLQVTLGLLQGYFRAWHSEQDTYHLHAVHHYLIVGFMMIGFSFVKIISPVVFITIFGVLLCICGAWEFFRIGQLRDPEKV
ncbi:hypothetical protein PGH26_10570 [Sporosarcina jeotgali]|uniref:DUF308 domain-containing protein n=1 Tax=Sporosarcina jeotgali TaxID=3020056 RepID=A0ABZ0KVB3_9BACL|nr:hypothetical protein [Sporosarcina sp. B2O-1]WOV83366.1 hypothetical protein PGH26_10570 [Sporosarcina sp. B2O-1]